jgi:hypothetical protein
VIDAGFDLDILDLQALLTHPAPLFQPGTNPVFLYDIILEIRSL